MRQIDPAELTPSNWMSLATIDKSPSQLVEISAVNFEKFTDDFDECEVAYFDIDGTSVILRRYNGYPAEITAIDVDLSTTKTAGDAIISQALAYFRLTPANIAWRQTQEA